MGIVRFVILGSIRVEAVRHRDLGRLCRAVYRLPDYLRPWIIALERTADGAAVETICPRRWASEELVSQVADALALPWDVTVCIDGEPIGRVAVVARQRA
jgi:hypothetical protein